MASPIIGWGDEEDAALKEVALKEVPQYRCASCILETKTKAGSTAGKAPAPRTNPNIYLGKKKEKHSTKKKKFFCTYLLRRGNKKRLSTKLAEG